MKLGKQNFSDRCRGLGTGWGLGVVLSRLLGRETPYLKYSEALRVLGTVLKTNNLVHNSGRVEGTEV